MIGVLVWKAAWSGYLKGSEKGSPGHAAMWLRAARRHEYISFWPGTPSGFLEWRQFKLHREYEQDKRHYGRNADYGRIVPDNSGGKPGLDIDGMFDRWDRMVSRNPDYSRKFQCSRVVLALLVAGGANQYLHHPKNSLLEDAADWWASHVIYAWSPDDVKDYTEAVVRGIKKARAS